MLYDITSYDITSYDSRYVDNLKRALLPLLQSIQLFLSITQGVGLNGQHG